jgi:hypothetical protein
MVHAGWQSCCKSHQVSRAATMADISTSNELEEHQRLDDVRLCPKHQPIAAHHFDHWIDSEPCL